MRRALISLFSFGLIAAWLSPVRAGEQPGEKPADEKPNLEVVHLTIHPAPEPRPALKYRLTPSYLVRTSGNAAPLYFRAFLLLEARRASGGTWEKVVAWQKTPLEELPVEEVSKALDAFASTFHEAEMASRRTHCDWGLPIREEDNPFNMTLLEANKARELGFLVALRARLQIAQKKYDEAIGSLRVGCTLARHIAKGPTLVNGLVGIAVFDLMAAQLETLAQQPDAPNMYWALTSLPRPMIDLHEALQLEAVTIYTMFPEMEQARRTGASPEFWEQALKKGMQEFAEMGLLEHSGGTKIGLPELETLIAKGAPGARRSLAAAGWPEEQVRAMSPVQAVLINTLEVFDRQRDGLFKWFCLPYWEAHDRAKEAEQRIQAECAQLADRQHVEAVPLGAMLLPAIERCCFAVARMERRLAALRTIEAVRLYAAEHDGRLPERLDQIEAVPTPLNPVTGKPFPYRLDGNTTTLDAEGGDRALRYVIRLAE